MLILHFFEKLLIEAKQVLLPGRDFSRKVLNSQKSINKALLEKNLKEAQKEMIKQVKEVKRDLIAIQKDRVVSSAVF